MSNDDTLFGISGNVKTPYLCQRPLRFFLDLKLVQVFLSKHCLNYFENPRLFLKLLWTLTLNGFTNNMKNSLTCFNTYMNLKSKTIAGNTKSKITNELLRYFLLLLNLLIQFLYFLYLPVYKKTLERQPLLPNFHFSECVKNGEHSLRFKVSSIYTLFSKIWVYSLLQFPMFNYSHK